MYIFTMMFSGAESGLRASLFVALFLFFAASESNVSEALFYEILDTIDRAAAVMLIKKNEDARFAVLDVAYKTLVECKMSIQCSDISDDISLPLLPACFHDPPKIERRKLWIPRLALGIKAMSRHTLASVSFGDSAEMLRETSR